MLSCVWPEVWRGVWECRELWMARWGWGEGIWRACSPSQTCQPLVPAQGSAWTHVRMRIGRAGGVGGRRGRWRPCSCPGVRWLGIHHGAVLQTKQGDVAAEAASTWWNGGSVSPSGESEPGVPCFKGVKGTLISGGAEPGTGERSGCEQVSEEAPCLARGGAHSGQPDRTGGGGGH